MKGKEVLNPMDPGSLIYTGHYVDHELLFELEEDCERRIRRKADGAPMRFLLTIGGAGAQKEIFREIIKHLLPSIREKRLRCT